MKRFYILFPILFYITEFIVLSFVFTISFYFTSNNSFIPLNSEFHEAYFLSLLIWTIITLTTKDFKVGRNIDYADTLNIVARTVTIFIAFYSILWVLFNFTEMSRIFLGLFYVLLFLTFSISRVCIHIMLNLYRKKGGNYINAIIIGYDNQCLNLFNLFNKRPEFGIKCLGFYADFDIDNGLPKLGTTKDFDDASAEKVDIIYVSDLIQKPILNNIISVADNNYKKVKILPNFKTDYLKSYSLTTIENISIVDVNRLPLDSYFNKVVKRGFDIIFSLFVIICILSWLYPIIAIIIKLESKGPVIFKQLRNGKNNKTFYCLKFRTMVLNSVADSKWAVKNDPRITTFGKILRKRSIDELPQFFNVLMGEMAIVGPRPLAVKLNDLYKNRIEYFYHRHAFRPGITGLAQCMGYRGEIQQIFDIKNRVKLDRFYFKNWTFILDIKIIIRTIYVLLTGQQKAY